jgi:hypothetical protein
LRLPGGCCVRALSWVVIGVAGLLAAGTPAQAQGVSSVVIPGKAGVPVIIDGFDASFCVVESELGLDRPGLLPPAIIECPLIVRGRGRGSSSYYPARGQRPGYGRLEIEPPANRRLPPPAPSFYREWSSQSDPLPASLDPPAQVGPIVVQPTLRRHRRPARRHQ